MKTKKNLVNKMFMNILTAGTFAVAMTFGLTACNDELENNGAAADNASAEAGDYSQFEPYGLTYQNFVSENDVQILNADTTEIAVSKKLADKLGITSFVNHPLGIWQGIDQLPYARKAKEERLEGDMYILTVVPTTIAELVGDKMALLNTSIYVNDDAEAVQTRAASNGMPEFAAKYVDNDNIIHPAVIHLTDPYGYDNDIHYEDDPMDATQTRAAASGHYQYMTAEELAGGKTRFSVHPNVLSLKNKFNFYHRLEAKKGSGDTITISGNIPIDFNLNYFLTLDSELKWKWCIPYPSLKKFESGFDGKLEFSPEAYIGFSRRVDFLGKDNKKKQLCTFGRYSFTFMVGVIPVNIQICPNLYMKFNAVVEGGVRLGFKYVYKNEFKIGVKYVNGEWDGIKYFKEVKNDFDFVKPQLNFSANASIGLFFGLDVMLYGVAGPEMGVGSSLDAKASLNIKSGETELKKIFDFKGSVELGIKAYVGAKVSFLGYELGNWSTDINLIDPWVLKKYPSDGTEHKSPAQKEEEARRANIKPLMEHIYTTDSQLKQECENAIFQLMQIKNMYRDETIGLYYDEINKENGNVKVDVTNAQSLAKALQTVKTVNTDINNAYEGFQIMKRYEELDNLMKSSDIYKFYSTKVAYWEDGIDLNKIYKWFRNTYKRDPEMTNEDLKVLMDMLNNYSTYFYQDYAKSFSVHHQVLSDYTKEVLSATANPEFTERAICETIFYYYVKKGGLKMLGNESDKNEIRKDFITIYKHLQNIEHQRQQLMNS